ncbi:poly-beta-1,6-N-acetyl-D-glucosamine biosynthesis protein PgaD [Pseudomonas xionganensis]|uniref:Poly-beta-1,6-N-acetyl-D-glucosamine biosynthesis protein PgaD n=1 Tax=Pseudomonas xionganensis TaxID=2654845 RepID=A0A6I4KQ15_9PSED|nr:poly-beta-1,6-N-acetyl-D-glucosamine biosynthesis protein PgaD [Pseudomonas xionganensis]MVW73731.1 poly-beta-1,6-N-acetyl-D-glucosamine biosynthesis protein PgaD [Pseudomonas xionganensis]
MSLLIRTQQRLLPRVIDIALTLAAWAGMAYLVMQGVKGLLQGEQNSPRLWFGIEFLQTLDTLLVYLLVGLAIGALLLAWAKYNERRAEWYERRERMPDICERGLSANFQVSLPILDCLQNQQVLILHNHAHGALAAIEFPGTGLRLPAQAEAALLKELEAADAEAAPALLRAPG